MVTASPAPAAVASPAGAAVHPPPTMPASLLHLWRHPRPQTRPIGPAGRCIGQTDLPVDRRRAKRLAHRIRAAARRHGWPHEVHTSHLQRCASVGRILRQWGWRHHVDTAWAELHFGDWDGRLWADIPVADLDAWVAQFAHHRPPGGESLADLVLRLEALLRRHHGVQPLLVVAHAGVMQTLSWWAQHPAQWPDAHQWGRAPVYMQHQRIAVHAGASIAVHSAPSLECPHDHEPHRTPRTA